jgi:arginine-tRNA-protein transferase
MDPHASSDVVICDEPQRCPYLPGRTARLPLRWPGGTLTRAQLDRRLAEGDRRSGYFLYRASCQDCSACEAIRVDARAFRPSRTQRRIDRRGRQNLAVSLGPARVDAERLHLFNQHRQHRQLARRGDQLDAAAYRAFLVESCCESFEIAYRMQDRLVAVAICDRGSLSLSAVYCYFDVAYSHLSPGVFSVLTQIRLCREWHMTYLYLGYHIATCRPMSYKEQYRPHERLVEGVWQRYPGGR